MVATICDDVWMLGDRRSHHTRRNQSLPARSVPTNIGNSSNVKTTIEIAWSRKLSFYLRHNISRGQMAGMPSSILLGACGYFDKYRPRGKAYINLHTKRREAACVGVDQQWEARKLGKGLKERETSRRRGGYPYAIAQQLDNVLLGSLEGFEQWGETRRAQL